MAGSMAEGGWHDVRVVRVADRQGGGPGTRDRGEIKSGREKQSQNFGDKFKASPNLSHFVISSPLPISSRPPPLPPPPILLLPFLFFFHAIAARLTQTTQITIKINTSAVGPNVSS